MSARGVKTEAIAPGLRRAGAGDPGGFHRQRRSGASRDPARPASGGKAGRHWGAVLTIVDTSALIDSLIGPKRSADRMREVLAAGERLLLLTLVLYEWWRGPWLEEQLTPRRAPFPRDQALPFGVAEANVASRLYEEVSRPRGGELDLAIAAHTIVRDAQLWSLNVAYLKTSRV
jgi:predicted nucleic acid-binding protein